MSHQDAVNADAINKLQQRQIERVRKLSLDERGQQVWAACQAAAEIETSRRRMGLPPSEPAPWPESTRQFLAEVARRVRER